MGWVWLLTAIVLEIAGTTCMKLSQGFTQLWPSVGVGVFYLLCFGALTLAIEHIDLSLAYAIWAGVGTAAIALIGIAVFGEAITALKLLSIALIVAGVVGLNLAGSGH